MARALLIGRLAARDLRRRRAQAALMLVPVAAATAALTLGLALNGVTSHPYQRTRAATDGPDVVAQSSGLAGLTALEHAPGVTGYSGPFPVAGPSLRADGHLVTELDGGFMVEGRSQDPAGLDRPEVIAGTWVRPGAVVVEPTYAAELGIKPGDRVTVAGRPFRVAGLAVTAAWGSVNTPGLIWMTTADARSLASPADRLSYLLNLRLSSPASAPAFSGAHSTRQLYLTSWQETASKDAREVQFEQVALSVGSWLLAMLAIASVAVLAGGRVAAEVRRAGLLKAVGGTPGLTAAVLLAEYLALALAAAASGLAAGWLAAPLLSGPADGLIGAPGRPALTPVMVGAAAAVAVGVTLIAALIPVLRVARVPAVAALSGRTRPPRRGGWLIAASRRLPAALLVGMRLAARRPWRMVLGAVSVMVTVTMVITILGVLEHQHESKVPGGLINPVHAGVDHVVVIVTIALVLLAAVHVTFATWATVAETRRPLAVFRSLGASQGQVSAGVAAAQLVAALPGAILGVPAGLGLLAATSHGGTPAFPAAWELLAAVAGTQLVVAGLAVITARAAARRPPAEGLRYQPA